MLPNSPIKLVDVLKDVREARNASVGHPKTGTRRRRIRPRDKSLYYGEEDGFQLMSYSEKSGTSFRYVPVLDLIATQRKEAVRIRDGSYQTTEKTEDEEHKSAFRTESLKDTFHLVLYAFEKISGGS